MAKCNLNGISIDEVNRNAANAYAAGIDSGEIFTVEGCHSKKGNPMLRVIGRALVCRGFDGSTFAADGCILYNPPIIKAIIDLCDNSDASIFIVGGTVTKTAPATATTSDTVVSKTDLQKEMDEIKAKFFQLSDAEQKAATARMKAIETALNA